MKAKHWLMFCGVQLAGFLVGMGASHVDRLSWFVSFALLLPGMLLSIPLFTQGYPANFWPKCTIFAIAITVNSILFGFLAFVLAKRRHPEAP